jgi:uncharacterized protein involved in exopolysaccharide biosynthesis
MSPEPALIRKPSGVEAPRTSELKVANYGEFNEAATPAAPRTSVVFRILLDGWYIVVLAALVAAGLSVALAMTMPFAFTATATLFPAMREAGIPAAGLQRLFGVGLPQSVSTDEAISTLTSTRFLSTFVTKHDYLPILFPDAWDPAAGTWKNKQPTLMGAVRALRRSLVIRNVPLSVAMTVSYTGGDPKVTADTLNQMIAELNEGMRQEAIERSRKLIDHYQQTLQSSDRLPADLRAHVVTLMSEEMKTLASAESSDSYAVRVTDPAYPPELRSAPQRTVMTVVGTLFGLFIGLLIVFSRHFVRGVREDLRQDRTRTAAAEAS